MAGRSTESSRTKRRKSTRKTRDPSRNGSRVKDCRKEDMYEIKEFPTVQGTEMYGGDTIIGVLKIEIELPNGFVEKDTG